MTFDNFIEIQLLSSISDFLARPTLDMLHVKESLNTPQTWIKWEIFSATQNR